MAVLGPASGRLAGAELSARSSPIGALAREQYAALASMRWCIFRNSLRSNRGVMELGARSLTLILYSLMGLGLSIGLGAGAYAMVANHQMPLLALLYWVVFLLWQIMPVSLASFQEQFDMGGVLRFPVGFGAFFLLHLVFGLVDISTIMGVLACLGIWIGTSFAEPTLSAWAAGSLTLFSLFNILLVRAIFAWIDRWLAQRRTREIVGAVFFVILLSLQLLNPAFHGQRHGQISSKTRQESMRALQVANSVQQWLPPGLASYGVDRASQYHPVEALESFSILASFLLVAGGALGIRLRGEYRGENLGEAPAQRKTERRTGKWLLDGSSPLSAVLEKEFRTLMRALPLLYGLGAPLIMVLVLSGLYSKGGSLGGHPVPLSLLISLAYATVGFTQLFYNNLGTEGPGIKILFLSPTPIRTVVLAKNLFHSLLFAMDAILVCAITSFRNGIPSLVTLAATAAWLLFALPVHLAAGNAFSLTMPYRINLGRMTRQRGSQASALLSMLIQIGVLGLGAGVFALCSFFDRLWLAVPILLCMAVVAALVWMRVLRNVEAMANRYRDSLIAALVKTE